MASIVAALLKVRVDALEHRLVDGGTIIALCFLLSATQRSISEMKACGFWPQEVGLLL
jgi:hypothetical protein